MAKVTPLETRLRAKLYSLVGKRLFDLRAIQSPNVDMVTTCLAISRLTGMQFRHTKKGKRKLILSYAIQEGLVKEPEIEAPKEKLPLSPRVPKVKKTSKAVFNAFYTSQPWRSLRYAALKKHGAACQCCGGTAKSTGSPLHVDHIKPRSKYPDLELRLDNLQVLCEDCNMGKGGRDQTDWRYV